MRKPERGLQNDGIATAGLRQATSALLELAT